MTTNRGTSETAQRKRAGWPPRLSDIGREGLKVRVAREFRTGSVAVPIGTAGIVTTSSNGWHLLHFEGEGCAHCGCKPRASRMSWRDFEVLPS